MTKSRAERFPDALDELFQVEPEFFIVEKRTPERPALTAIVYRDVPEQGTITGITYGLSEVPHPDWKHGRPELIISVDSSDTAWPLAVADMAANLRGKCPFCYGDVINFGEQVSDESDMSAFLVFAPSILDREDTVIDVGDWKINLAGVFPIYDSERDVYSKIGLEAFWHHPDFDLFAVQRARVSAD